MIEFLFDLIDIKISSLDNIYNTILYQMYLLIINNRFFLSKYNEFL